MDQDLSFKKTQDRRTQNQEQILAYSRDFARIYRKEKEQRAQAEEMHQKLLAVVNGMSEGMVATDKKLIIQEVNSSFANIFNTRQQACLGASLRQFVPSDKLKKYITLKNQTRRSSIDFEFTPADKEKTVYWVSVSDLSPTNTNEGGFVFLFRDVTDSKGFEHLKSQFIKFASQEIRVPLNGLLSLIEQIYEHFRTKLTREELSYFNFLKKSGRSLQSLIEDMIRISPLRSGEELNKTLVKLDDLMVDVLRQFEDEINIQDIRIQFEVQHSGSIFIDQDLLGRVLFNMQKIVSNYTLANGTITIEMFQSGQGLHLRFTCPDITPDDRKELQKMVSSPYYLRESIEDSGIGLALAKEIIEWHGGKFRIETEKDLIIDLEFPFWSESLRISA